MSAKRWMRAGGIVMALVTGGLALPAPAAAHCDSLDGPVVRAALEALTTGRVEPVLRWVRPGDEPEIRAAFERTLRVREHGGEALELADRWFFETLVRVHREGEGAPYTGLQPAGYAPSAGIAAADRALESGSVAGLTTGFGHDAAAALEERYERVTELRERADESVEAGRRYVDAYVEYIHFVEKLDELIHGSGEFHGS